MFSPDNLKLFVKDIDRARSFYKNVFQWQEDDFTPDTNFIIFDIDHNNDFNRNQNASQQTVDIIDVTDIDYLLKRVKMNGGSISVPKIYIPSVGFLAYFVDTEGNVIGIVEKEDDPPMN